jgi:nucleotide-binding universal stress UspA family protein
LTDESSGAGLVVIGTRGLGRLVGTLLGSVAFAVAARAECPVVVVKGEPADRPSLPERRIVVGTDGSAPAAAAVAFAAERAAQASAELHLVVCTGEHPDFDSEELRATAEAIAATTARHVSKVHPELSLTTRVEDCPAERMLVDSSAEADLVVVGTRGRGAVTGLWLGSVCHAVIHGAECPVAVVGGELGGEQGR